MEDALDFYHAKMAKEYYKSMKKDLYDVLSWETLPLTDDTDELELPDDEEDDNENENTDSSDEDTDLDPSEDPKDEQTDEP